MTGLLLDTHALVWAAAAPDRLGPAARSAIESPTSTLHVSAASAWELATKYRTGRFPEAEALVSGFDDVCNRLRALPVAITHRHALRAGGFSWDHRDPFDRMLAAQALLDDLILVTTDPAFAALPGIRLLW
ncbi:MAG: type II toxin-antitoxin system VapC family toxin [Acidimicrobiia bacterium]|jgi:PIN domain nuclease of toxin-antitoxin system|nr:type II toxin-antitoxin system VapC family toxin [Acidimicrobiia bacterium]